MYIEKFYLDLVAGELQWTAVEPMSCSEDENRAFTPAGVYAVSSTKVIITGSDSLLYR